MPVFELARFQADPSSATELLTRHTAAVDAIRRQFPELIQANLARLDEDTWIDIWKWADLDAAKKAADQAPTIPEAAAMFALITNVVAMEHAEIVDER